MGFLNDFIRRNLKEYLEPVRKGVPREEPIGLSKNKYHGCLLMLTDTHPSDIAHKLGVSYSLVRRWQADENFRELKKKLYADFSVTIKAAIRIVNDKNLEEMIGSNFFDDAHKINVELKDQIISELDALSARLEAHRLLLMLQIMKQFISADGKRNENLNKKIRRIIKDHGKKLLKNYREQFPKGESVNNGVNDLLALLSLLLDLLKQD
jgi:hypothetical protein